MPAHLTELQDLYDNLHDLAQAPDDIKAKMREAIHNGTVEFCQDCLETMSQHGLSRGDIIAMISKAIGGTH